MCIICVINANSGKKLHSKRDEKILEATRSMNQEIAVGLLGPENSRELKTGYAKILRETADMIEAAIKDEDVINEVTKDHLAPLEAAVKRTVEDADTFFRSQYGIPMPDELRMVVTGRAYDAALVVESSSEPQCAVKHPNNNAICQRIPGHEGAHFGKLGGELSVWK